MTTHVFEQRAVMMALLGALGGQEIRRAAIDANKQAEGSTLPYILKGDSINTTNNFTPDVIAALKETVNKAKQSTLNNV